MYTPPPMNPEVARLRRQSAERKLVKRMRFLRRLWLVAALLFVVLFVEVCVALCFSPRFWIYRLQVTGVETLTTGEIIRLAALPVHSNYYRAPLGRMARRIQQGDPRVAKVTVRRGKVGTLVIEVRERQAIARIGDASPPIYLDAQGVLFTRPKPPTPPVPVVEGIALPAGKVRFGTSLTTPRAGVVKECLAALRPANAGDKRLDVSRVLIREHDWVTLVLRQGTKVLLGRPKFLPEKVWWVRKLIAQASQDGYALHQLEYLNVRVITKITDLGAVYKPKPDVEAPLP